MKRPLLVITVGYIIGIVWGLYCNCSIALLYAIISAIWLIHKLLYTPVKKFKLISFKRYFRYIKLILKFNVIIAIVISSFISNIITASLDNKYETLYSNMQDDLQIIGIVVSNKKEKEYKDVYKIKVEKINNSTKYVNTYLILNVKRSLNKDISYGDKVLITGEFQAPSEKRNYKGFDYKEYLKTQKIYGTIKASGVKELDTNCGNYVLTASNNIFLRIKRNIEIAFPERQANLLLGIMLGYTENLDEDITQSFRDSNISHILAVSGMHISYIILGLMIVFKKEFGKRRAHIITIFILVIYMFITGCSPSVVRATIMGVLMLFASIIHRKNDTWNSIAISLLVILIYNPYLINSVSVLLSYGGTIGIIVFSKQVLNLLDKIKIKSRKYKYVIKGKTKNIIEKLKEILSITISAQIVIMPIMVLYFNTAGITFFITNTVVSIIIGPIIILGFVCIVLGLFSVQVLKFISIILVPLLELLIFIPNIGNMLPLNKIYIATPKIYQIVMYYVLSVMFNYIVLVYHTGKPNAFQIRVKNLLNLFKYKFRQNKNKVLSAILIICILATVVKIIPKDLCIHFVDVGQGDCTFIVTPNNNKILIDGGGSESSDYDVGKNTLLPYLLDRNCTKIDYMFISHFDKDHIGGLLTILEELKVKNVIICKQCEQTEEYTRFKQITTQNKINVHIAGAGAKIVIEKGLEFIALFPCEDIISENAINNNSLVLKLVYNNFSMLFTGDIEQEAEEKLLSLYKKSGALKSDVLKVAHHGSKSSSTIEFLQVVNPNISLIGVGVNNLYKHPSQQTLDNLESINTKIYRTDENGEITITVGKHKKIEINTML